MKKLILIFTSLVSISGYAQGLVVAKPDLVVTKPDLTLFPETVLESLERANLFAEALSADDEGGWSGNGGGSRDESDNIWFIGDSPIKYCFSKAKDYPLNGNQIHALIKTSIKSWVSFFDSYGLTNVNLAGGYPHPRLNSLQFPSGENKKLTTEFAYTNDCSKARLQFLFGIENKIIKNYKKFATDHPYGLAVRQKYDHKNFAHSGVVWIDNFTKDKKEIRHMLLHELGHVFGMEHDSVPVMDEDMMKFLGSKRELLTSFLGKIESDSWTYSLKENHPIVMTSTKGRRPKRRNHPTHELKQVCGGDPTFTPNRQIPRPVLRGFGLRKQDCHKLTLTYLGKLGQGRKRNRAFTLEIEELFSKRKATFNGRLKPSQGRRPQITGPGVVTELKVDRPLGKKQKVFKKLTLEKSPNMLPLTGTFSLGQEKFAAKMTSYKGLVIELFVPEAKAWWTFKTHYNQN